MSLAIDIDKVEDVLLADGWHHVHKQSFDIDAYEFMQGPEREDGTRMTSLGGGVREGVVSTGATWQEKWGAEQDPRQQVYVVSCPLTSVLAVRLKA